MAMHVQWDEKKIIAAIKRWKKEHGKPPTSAEWSQSGPYWPVQKTVCNRFGTWNNGIRAAGFKPLMPKGAEVPSPQPAKEPTPKREVTYTYAGPTSKMIVDALEEAMEPLRRQVMQLQRAVDDATMDHADALALRKLVEEVHSKLDTLPTSKQQQAALMNLGKARSEIAEVRRLVDPPVVAQTNGNGNGHHEESRGIIARIFG